MKTIVLTTATAMLLGLAGAAAQSERPDRSPDQSPRATPIQSQSQGGREGGSRREGETTDQAQRDRDAATGQRIQGREQGQALQERERGQGEQSQRAQEQPRSTQQREQPQSAQEQGQQRGQGQRAQQQDQGQRTQQERTQEGEERQRAQQDRMQDREQRAQREGQRVQERERQQQGQRAQDREQDQRAQQDREQDRRQRVQERDQQQDQQRAQEREQGQRTQQERAQERSREPDERQVERQRARDDQDRRDDRQQRERAGLQGDRDWRDGRAADRRGRTDVSVQIPEEQRTRIVERLWRDEREVRTNVNIRVSVGAELPRYVRVRELPPDIVEIVPQYRGYYYTIVRDEIVIVEPRTRRVVATLPRSGAQRTASRSETRGIGGSRSEVRLQLDPEERRMIREYALQHGPRLNQRLNIRVGQRVPQWVNVDYFDEEILDDVPELRDYEYFVVEDEIVIVDPWERRVVDVII
jgi:hypothetical protein